MGVVIPAWIALLLMVGWGALCALASPVLILLAAWLYTRHQIRKAMHRGR